jgi:hypothetical protein
MNAEGQKANGSKADDVIKPNITLKRYCI